MKNSLNKFLLIILFILNVSCESKTGGSTITISSECNNGQSLGCDGICSSSPLENDVCGVCGGEITILSECPLLQCASDVCISIQNVNLSSNVLEVWMVNNIPVRRTRSDPRPDQESRISRLLSQKYRKVEGKFDGKWCPGI